MVGPYATNMIAPAMPVVMQKGKVFVAVFGLAVNSEFNYPKYFAMIPTGQNTKPSFTEGFFDVAAKQDPRPTTVAIVAADAEFARNACEGARENAKKNGFNIVYDRTYPPSTTDFTPIVRAIQATNPDVVNICSYPPDSVGMVRTRQRSRLQAEDGRRRDGRPAGDRDQDAAWPAAQRLRQLRNLGAVEADDERRRSRRS